MKSMKEEIKSLERYQTKLTGGDNVTADIYTRTMLLTLGRMLVILNENLEEMERSKEIAFKSVFQNDPVPHYANCGNADCPVCKPPSSCSS